MSLVLKMCHNKNHNSFSPFPPCSKTQIWSQSFSVIPLQPVYLTCGQVSFLFLASESFHLSPKISTFYHGAGTQLLWPMFWFRPRAWLLFKKVKLGKGRKGRQNTPEIKLIVNLSKILMKGLFKKASVSTESHKSLVSKSGITYLKKKKKKDRSHPSGYPI